MAFVAFLELIVGAIFGIVHLVSKNSHNDSELKRKEIDLQIRELELKRKKLDVKETKFGNLERDSE